MKKPGFPGSFDRSVRGGGLEPGSASADECDPAANKADRDDGPVRNETVGDALEASKDRSETNPRDVLIASLRQAIDDGMVTGDGMLVRVAIAALAQLAGGR